MRPRTFRIAHFGDLHLDDFDEEYDWVLHMVERARDEGADHLVFTGDIVDEAQVHVVEALLDDLARQGFGKGRASFVPGNHDIYPLGHPPSPAGVWRALARRSQRNWERLCALSERHHGGSLTRNGIPWLRRLTPGVVIVGLDSTRSSDDSLRTRLPTSWAEGHLEEEQVDLAGESLGRHADATHRVVLMHHYPFDDFPSASDWVPMHFAEPTAATVRNWLEWMGATTVLCGHIHGFRDRRTARGVRVLCTDSTAYEYHDGRTGRAFLLLTLGPGRRVSPRLVLVDEE
jgi:3',5'-cyclic AMP phosphodiesterase CpdA